MPMNLRPFHILLAVRIVEPCMCAVNGRGNHGDSWAHPGAPIYARKGAPQHSTTLTGLASFSIYLTIYTPAKRSFRRVYCFQPVRDSVIP